MRNTKRYWVSLAIGSGAAALLIAVFSLLSVGAPDVSSGSPSKVKPPAGVGMLGSPRGLVTSGAADRGGPALSVPQRLLAMVGLLPDEEPDVSLGSPSEVRPQAGGGMPGIPPGLAARRMAIGGGAVLDDPQRQAQVSPARRWTPTPEARTWTPTPEESEGEEFSRERLELEDVRTRLRSPDPQERIDAIDELKGLDVVVATRELDNLLRGAETDEEVRLKAFEELTELAKWGEADEPVAQVLIRGLRDPSPQVREQAAWLLQFEDQDQDPRILSALREAYAREQDPDVRDSLEQSLEFEAADDPDFDS